jgi:hypothetical protein
MKTALIGLFSAVLLVGGAAAQDATPTGTPPPEPQTSNPSQPQTSTPADTQTPQQLPESQATANQNSPQSAPQQPATQTQTPQTQVPQASSASTQPNTIKRVAPGSVIPVELTKSIDAKKAKSGDEVVAKVTMDLKSNSGEVVFAKDTKVVGHVTEAQARNKDQKESQVGIMFDKAVTKTGDMQLPMSIQAVIAPQNPNNTDQGGNANNATAATAGTARPSGMSGSNQAQPPAAAPTNNASTGTDAAASPRPQITGNTQGVVGFSNLNLAAAPDSNQGSVLTSDKNNVKLDSGTFMLLRVNQ